MGDNKMKLDKFRKKFIPHNYTVNLYTVKEVYIDNGKVKANEWNKVWSGMDWQIKKGYAKSDYFRVYPNVLPCPYTNNKVLFIRANDRLMGIDEVSVVIEIKE